VNGHVLQNVSGASFRKGDLATLLLLCVCLPIAASRGGIFALLVSKLHWCKACRGSQLNTSLLLFVDSRVQSSLNGGTSVHCAIVIVALMALAIGLLYLSLQTVKKHVLTQ
jgi:hypothetical protein